MNLKRDLAIIFLASTTLLFAGLFINERQKHSEIQSPHDILADSEAPKSRQAQLDKIESDLAESKQSVRDAVSGVYEYDKPNLEKSFILDFRSDGSVLSYYTFAGRETQMAKKFSKWSFNKEVISIDGIGDFTPDGNDDLIDSEGNRWLHIR